MTPSAPISRLSEYLHDIGNFKRLVWPLRPRLSHPLQSRTSDMVYTGVSFDSRSTQPGDLFVAYQGLRRDSHQYISEALERGAAAVCCEYLPGRSPHTPFLVVHSGRRALSAAAAVLYDFPTRNFNTVGVTGTNGKTTTTFMITRCFEAAGLRTGLLGTLAYKLDEDLQPSAITTPDAPDLQRLLADMRRRDVSHVTMEVSSHALAQDRAADLSFSTAAITNISPDHLDVHQSLEEYLDAKAQLFQSLEPGSVAVYNADDPFATAVARQTTSAMIGVGQFGAAEARIFGDMLVFGKDVARLANREPASVQLSLRMPGSHNMSNAAIAATIAYLHGVPLAAIEGALNSFHGLPRRLQVVHDGDFQVLDDFAHNPGSLHAVFDTLAHERMQPTIIVNAVRGNRGALVNQDNARIIAQWAPRLNTRMILISRSDDVVGAKDLVSPEETAAFERALARAGLKYEVHDTLVATLQRVLEEVHTGDRVLLLGAQGMDPAAEILTRFLREDFNRTPVLAQYEFAEELGAAGWTSPRWKDQIHRSLFVETIEEPEDDG